MSSPMQTGITIETPSVFPMGAVCGQIRPVVEPVDPGGRIPTLAAVARAGDLHIVLRNVRAGNRYAKESPEVGFPLRPIGDRRVENSKLLRVRLFWRVGKPPCLSGI